MENYPIHGKIDRRLSLDHGDYLYFSGTAYLGMGSLPEFEKLIIQGIQKYGPNHGASRFSNVQLQVYEELERHFAAEAGASEAALLSSGYLAASLAMRMVRRLADELWVAPDAHPAILPLKKETVPYDTFENYIEFCIRRSQQVEGQTIGIISNAVDTILPSIHTFDWINQLSPHNDYYLLIDDSHAFGLLGRGIYGTYSQWKNLPAEVVVAGSLGKALAIPAGIILSKHHFIDKIKKSSLFRGASPPLPGYCEAFMSAEHLYQRQLGKLKDNLTFFLQKLPKKDHIRYDPTFPVITFKKSGWAEKLAQKGILISSFAYPHPQDPVTDRIIISAYHHKADLDKLIAAMH